MPDALYLKATGKNPEDIFPALRERPAQPEISRFFGIVIKMFFDDHNPPPSMRSMAVMSRWLIPHSSRLLRSTSTSVTGLVIEWATLQHQELLDDWDKARAREELQKIAPLV